MSGFAECVKPPEGQFIGARGTCATVPQVRRHLNHDPHHKDYDTVTPLSTSYEAPNGGSGAEVSNLFLHIGLRRIACD